MEEAPSLTLLMKSVSRHLSTPYKTGVYISIPDLIKVARNLDLPVVVKDTREWMVEELFKIALDYGKLGELIDSLVELLNNKSSQIQELINQYPLAKPLYTDIVENTRKTIEKLKELKKIYIKYYT